MGLNKKVGEKNTSKTRKYGMIVLLVLFLISILISYVNIFPIQTSNNKFVYIRENDSIKTMYMNKTYDIYKVYERGIGFGSNGDNMLVVMENSTTNEKHYIGCKNNGSPHDTMFNEYYISNMSGVKIYTVSKPPWNIEE